MKCFKCSDQFKTVNLLTLHLKLKHGCLQIKKFRYECCNEKCLQSFQNFSAFKKHLKNCVLVKKKIQTTSKRGDLEFWETDQKHQIQLELPQENIDIRSEKNSNSSVLNNHIESNNFRFLDFGNELKEKVIEFILKLHGHDNFCRKDVLKIQELTSQLISNIFSFLSQLSAEFCDQNDSNKLNSFLNYCEKTFSELDSEHKFIQEITKQNIFVKPENFLIDKQITEVYKNGNIYYGEQIETGALMPIDFQFQKFFEKNNNLTYSLNKIKSMRNNESMSHFVQGELFTQKCEPYPDKNVIPYFLFFDSVEINNPLGSNAGSHAMTAIYYSFPTAENCNKRKNIFLAGLVKTKDIKERGNDVVLNTLINHLIDVEKGLNIKTNNGFVKVHFVLGLVLGDNLGLNEILDFSKSFSASQFCRFCCETKEMTSKMCIENHQSIRNLENYDNSLNSENSSNGIKKYSLLNNIPSFHVTKNFAIDIMHDVFEGICHYDLSHSLLYFIDKGYFTLHELNRLKQTFNYGEQEIGNLSKPISEQNLKNKKMKMSAREMWTFSHFLPLIIGHLIKETDPVWQFVCDLIKLIDILLLPSFNENTLCLLNELVAKHNGQYLKLFKDNLKPKHHFLVHYSRVIRYSGPPKYYWSFNFEAKHQEIKKYARVINSRRNIALSLAIKFQLKFAEKIYLTEQKHYVIAEEKHIFPSEFRDIISKKINQNSNFKCFSQLIIRDQLYKKNLYLTKTENNSTYVFLIMELVVVEHDEITYILCKEMPSVYLHHFVAYEILINLGSNNPKLFSFTYFDGPPMQANFLPNKKLMIRKKTFN